MTRFMRCNQSIIRDAANFGVTLEIFEGRFCCEASLRPMQLATPAVAAGAVVAPVVLLVLVMLPLGVVADLTGPQLTSPTSDAQFVFDYLGGGNPQSPAYLRCKMTHRCNRAISQYDGQSGTLTMVKDSVYQSDNFRILSRQRPIELFANFEDWHAGTVGWSVDQVLLEGTLNATIGAHVNPWDRAHIVQGPLDRFLGLSLYELAFNDTYELVFNTTSGMGAIYNDTLGMDLPGWTWPAVRVPQYTFPGVIMNTTKNDTEIAVWNFLAIYLGFNMRVNITGNRPMVLMSRGSIIIDRPITIAPGTLGGMPGAKTVSPYQNNQHGPGSPARRVYWQTVRAWGDNVDEVQSITTVADQGQNLGGYFRLGYKGSTTAPIPSQASAAEVRAAIEQHLPLAGLVHVVRSPRDNQGGFTWTITFQTAVGDIPQITVVDELTGIGHKTWTNTTVNGNTISGSFKVSFLNSTTRPISVAASALEFKNILEADLNIINAEVIRNDPTELCEAGLCPNGPQAAWGHTWSFTMVTNQSIIAATSPTDHHPTLQTTLPTSLPVLTGVNVTSSVVGAFANATMFNGFDYNEAIGQPVHSYTSPVTISYGGIGGSYGGEGGMGHARHIPNPVYNDWVLTDLVGGSGGAVGGEVVHQTLALEDTVRGTHLGYGGAGGGVLELVATNDIIINKRAAIHVDGEPGEDSFRGGGGGSGGSFLMSAGGVIVVHGSITARGGRGGRGIGWGSRGGGGGGGGRIAGFAQSLSLVQNGLVDVSGGVGGLDNEIVNTTVRGPPPAFAPVEYPPILAGSVVPPAARNGGKGTIDIVTAAGANYRIELDGQGAEGTTRSLRLEAKDQIVLENGVVVRSPYASNGPAFTFPASNSGIWFLRRGVLAPENGAGGSGAHGGKNSGVTPRRVTVYVKMAVPKEGHLGSHWGAHICLHEFDFRPISNDTGFQTRPVEGNYPGATGANGPGGAGSAGGGGVAGDGGLGGGVGNDAEGLIGVAIVDGKWKHQANYRHTPGFDLPVDSPQTVAFRHVEPERWYKVDIFIDWQNNTYKMRLDDHTVVLDAPFVGTKISRIGLYTFHQNVVWFDEVFVGAEDTFNFECPAVKQDQSLKMQRPLQSNWVANDLWGESTYFSQVHHDNFLSLRRAAVRSPNSLGVIPQDGPRHIQYHSDLVTRNTDKLFGTVNAGAMTYVPADELYQGRMPPRDLYFNAFTQDNDRSRWGVGARIDGNDKGQTGRWYWYGEHDVDTDQLGFDGYKLDRSRQRYQGGSVSCSTNDMKSWKNEGTMLHFLEVTFSTTGAFNFTELRLERPRVIYNRNTQLYVMWFYADDFQQSSRLAGVATSQFPDGPYAFSHLLTPDGNQTIDFTIFQDEDGAAFIARTYYNNQTYWIPSSIMQPIWESSKTAESTPDSPITDFGLSYHRAFYDRGYDNFEDIYIQRWRMEDLPWRVEIGDWIEVWNATAGVFYLVNATSGEISNLTIATPKELVTMHALALDSHTYRNITGQGRGPILTRFKDPADPKNSVWQPWSVPAVKTQTWQENYQDKNIADNPLHPTVADLLIGPERIVEVRRAKYIAISRLTNDYLNVSELLLTMEGELENEDDLITILSQFGRFGWTDTERRSSVPSGSTFLPDMTAQGAPFQFRTQDDTDWLSRHWQYITEKHDRYHVSGVLPSAPNITYNNIVNFRDKQVDVTCARLHYLAETKLDECHALRDAQVYVDLEPQLNEYKQLQSYARAMSTAKFEACLVDHEAARGRYERCIRAQLVDFNTMPPWNVGERDCVGGGGQCTRVANNTLPK